MKQAPSPPYKPLNMLSNLFLLFHLNPWQLCDLVHPLCVLCVFSLCFNVSLFILHHFTMSYYVLIFCAALAILKCA